MTIADGRAFHGIARCAWLLEALCLALRSVALGGWYLEALHLAAGIWQLIHISQIIFLQFYFTERRIQSAERRNLLQLT